MDCINKNLQNGGNSFRYSILTSPLSSNQCQENLDASFESGNVVTLLSPTDRPEFGCATLGKDPNRQMS